MHIRSFYDILNEQVEGIAELIRAFVAFIEKLFGVKIGGDKVVETTKADEG